MASPRVDLVCVACGVPVTWDTREFPIKACHCAGDVLVFTRTFKVLKESKCDVGPDVPGGGAA